MRCSKTFGIIFLSILAANLPALTYADSQRILSDMDLAGMAANLYGSGELPLGDQHYVTDAPRRGYIYLCHAMQGDGGAQFAGSWIHGNSWNTNSKPAVQGAITWDNAQFRSIIVNDDRRLIGNGLPINHTTGAFPVAQSDPAYNFDRNPNKITPQQFNDAVLVHPVYSDTPHCMGGEVGVMLTGVPLFNGFDAGMRDAPAHELQDSCNGHPQKTGEYHYHNLSPCIKDIGEKTVLGYALDGFPITGPLVAPGRYLTTANLDVCHGITSEIIEDGEAKVTYHYVMTQDFPYSVSCFRGTPSGMEVVSRNMPIRPTPPDQPPMHQLPDNTQQPPAPPTVALSACFRMQEGSPCNFISPRGDNILGTCRIPPMQSVLVCVPTKSP
jgi:hypothetical protein